MKFTTYVASAIVVALISGCAGSNTAKPESANATSTKSVGTQFKVGKSTKDDVMSILGKPNGTSIDTDGTESLVYSSMHQTGKAWIPFYFGSDRVRTNSAVYKFHNGILVSFSQSENHF